MEVSVVSRRKRFAAFALKKEQVSGGQVKQTAWRNLNTDT